MRSYTVHVAASLLWSLGILLWVLIATWSVCLPMLRVLYLEALKWG